MLDLNETIHDVLQLFEPQVRGKQVTVKARLDENLPVVRGDRGKLLQVLLNLLHNARDAVGPARWASPFGASPRSTPAISLRGSSRSSARRTPKRSWR